MKFRYKLIAVLLIVVMIIGVYHIGKYNNRLAEEAAEQSFFQTETVYLGYSDESFTDFFTGAAVAFHEENPDIRVIPKLIEGDDYLEAINDAAVKGEDFPDVYVITNDSIEKAYLAGLASENNAQTPVVNDAHFPKAAIEAVSYQNKLVGYPLFFETSVLVYNKTYLDEWVEKMKVEGKKQEEQLTREQIEAEGGVIEEGDFVGEAETESFDYDTLTVEDIIPETFEDIKNFADEYDAPEGVEGVFKWDVSDVFYNYFFAGNYMIVGGEAGDDVNNIDIYNENTIKCMNVYQNLNQFFSIDAETSSYDSMLENFFEGKFLFTIATSDVIEKTKAHVEESKIRHQDDLVKLEEKKAELDKLLAEEEIDQKKYDERLEKAPSEITPVFEIGYASIPELTSELESRSLSVTDVLVVNGYSQHNLAANKFAAFVTTKYSQNLYSKTGKIASSFDAAYTDDVLALFQEEYAGSIPLPKLVEASNFWVQLEITFTKIWTGEDADKWLRDLSEQIMTQVTGEDYKEDKIKVQP